MARKNQSVKRQDTCLCGSGEDYPQCCGQYLSGKLPETAEQLMRSRYTAFGQNAEDYLLASWHPKTRPASLDLSAQAPVQWIGLKVLNQDSQQDNASVEFVARFKVNGKAEKIHELSRFVKERGRWFYVDGDNIA